MNPSRKNQTIIHGEPSLSLETPRVKASLTLRGGHLAPVEFNLGDRWVSPYSLSPWKPYECEEGTPPILQVLRGDFFCLPFGDDPAAPPVHGESANGLWNELDQSENRLVAELTQSNGARIRKIITVGKTFPALYQEHVITGLAGDYNFGHHAVLQFPSTGGPYRVNVSPFRFGQVKPEPFTNPVLGEYSALKTGARIRSLKRVPLAAGGTTSLHEYPAREGFEDLAMISSKPGEFAWTAVTLDGYIWLSLKDPRVLPSTLFWFSNGGRHYPPWNGEHRRRLGLEEVCSHFSNGLSISRENRLEKEGVPTARPFRAGEAVSIRSVHAVSAVPAGFGMVVRITRRRGDSVRVTGDSGQRLDVPVNWRFLYNDASEQ